MKGYNTVMKRKLFTAVCYAVYAVAFMIELCVMIAKPTFSADSTVNKMWQDIIVRTVATVAFTFVMFNLGMGRAFALNEQGGSPVAPRTYLWCLPCFLVVLANFPFFALLVSQKATFNGTYMPLFIVHCLAIGLMEEVIFRAFLLPFINDYLIKKDVTYRIPRVIILSALIFGGTHLLNLTAGANPFWTVLQVGYSFLIGVMLGTTYVKTHNIWLCILLHATFDFGGNLIPWIGQGNFQDTAFWITTVVCGIICTLHVLWTFKQMKPDKELWALSLK